MFELRVILLCLPSILLATTLEPDNKSILTDSDWKKLWMEAGSINPSSKTDNTIDSSDSPVFDDTEMMAHNTTVQLGGTAFLVCKVAGVDRVGVNWIVERPCCRAIMQSNKLENDKKSNDGIDDNDEANGLFFLDNFEQGLQNLTYNNINTLTEAAGVGQKKAAEVFRIISNSQCPQGLLKLYLLDSIVKKVGGSYIELFDETLIPSFREVYLNADYECRAKLFKLRQSWNGFIHKCTLHSLDIIINDIDKNWVLTDDQHTVHNENCMKSEKAGGTVQKITHTNNEKAKEEEDHWNGSHGVIRKRRSLEEVVAELHSCNTKQIMQPGDIENGQEVIRKESSKVTVSHEIRSCNGNLLVNLTASDSLTSSKKLVQKIQRESLALTQVISTDWDDSYDDVNIGSTQTLLEKSIPARFNEDIFESEKKAFKSPMKKTQKPSRATGEKRSKIADKIEKPRIAWIETNKIYQMSTELLHYFFNEETQKCDKAQFLYRKDSVAIEINANFPGCVLYVVREPYEAKQFWRIQAYCSNLSCNTRYRLVAYYSDRTKFHISCNKPESIHLSRFSRQVRRYERDQEKGALMHELPLTQRQKHIKEAKDDNQLDQGSYGKVASLAVYQKIRTECLADQDNDNDDYVDIEQMISPDPNINFISNMLPRKTFAVYLHSKSQHQVLHKLHLKREKDGTPITCRLDATGNLVRAILDAIDQLLYYALTLNITIKSDKTSTPLPLSEQFNIRHRSKDIAAWLLDFKLSHLEWYDDPPLLMDYLISDFSYANFHAILSAFNNVTLKMYLQMAYEWILHNIEEGNFPDSYALMVKIRMCYTHLMHTFADMCKRHCGKTAQNHQLQTSKILLEILGSMIKAHDYNVILKLWRQMAILLSNEYESDDVSKAISEIESIVTDKVSLDDYNEEKLTYAVDVKNLPENQHDTLYKTNKFYLQFSSILNDTGAYVYGNTKKVKNPYHNRKFLDKFLKRFVPLLPLWTQVLIKTVSELSLPDLHILQDGNNQPIEGYFGIYKNSIIRNSSSLGVPPIKIGRAITFSRKTIDANIFSIEYLIPKSGLNSQKPRKPYTKQKKDAPLAILGPVEASKEIGPVEASKEIGPVDAFKDIGPVDAFKDIRPVDAFKEIGPVDAFKDIGPVDAFKEIGPVDAFKDIGPVDAFKDIRPVDAFKEIGPVDAFKDIGPVDASKEIGPVDAFKDIGPVEASKEIGPVDAFKDIGPVEASKEIGPVEASKEIGPVDAFKEIGPVEASKEIGPVDAFKDIGPVEAYKEIGPVEAYKEIGPVEASKDIGPVDAFKDIGPVDAFKDIGPVNAFKEIGPVEASKEIGPVKVQPNVQEKDPTSFVNAKESFKKKFRAKVTYFQRTNIQKIIKNRPVDAPVAKLETFNNGLFKNADMYFGLNVEFTVAKRNGLALSNTAFETLQPCKNLSIDLMQYLVHTFPKRQIQVEIEKTKDVFETPHVTFKLTKKNVFLLLCKNDHWVLFILDNENRTFTTLDPSQSHSENFFETFSKFIVLHNEKYKIRKAQLFWTEVSADYDKIDNNYDSGISVYNYMLQYINTTNISKTNFSTDVFRSDLKLQILKLSENLRNACLICGSFDENNMVECMKCSRWIHGVCVNINILEIKPEDIFHCHICTKYNLA